MMFKSKAFVRIVSVIIVTFMLMIPFTGVTLAGNQLDYVSKTESLADALDLKKGEVVEVIVKFASPSLLELNARSDDPNASSYEQKLLAEQDAILERLQIVPHFRYTGVINGAAITATEDEIRMLEQMGGVKEVYLSQSFTALGTECYQENAIFIPDIMEISSAISSNYTGDGVLVAVLDSGITFEHEAFNNTKYVQNPALTSVDLIKLGYSGGYYNAKIPFFCDYTDSDIKDCADVNGHGSHVAGIIAGYAENEDGTVKFSGLAPGAQICAMRVLDENGGGSDSNIVKALEDAYKLGVDIVNISFGRESAFRLGNHDALLSYIYQKFEEIGIMVVCSAGNFGSMAENTPRHVLDENCVDYGTLSLPAIYPGNIGVGSVSGGLYYTNAVTIGGKNYLYTDNVPADSPLDFKKAFSGKTVDIAYFDNYGKEEDYVDVDVTGKIVAVKRGELSFTDKCRYAVEAGAIGLIVINGETDNWGGMTINDQLIPAILVEYEVAEQLPISNGVITIGYSKIDVSMGGELSYFSSVGVTPDLEIGLDILGVGGTVTSVKSNTANEYVTYSGTSMAAPTITGTYALLCQMLNERNVGRDEERVDVASYIEDATQSTATLLSDDFGNLYSPRFQGAGLINLNKAAATNTYITTPLVCLGYDKSASGSISVEYELVNHGDEDVAYKAKVSAITDSFMQISPTDYKNNVTPMLLDSSWYTYVIYVNGVAVSHDEAFTLDANGSITVKLELVLSEMATYILSSAFPYGYFLDGFVEFYDVNDFSGSAIHGGYVSFVGDWLEGPALEPLTQTEIMDWLYMNGNDVELLPYFAAAHINANYNYTSILLCDEDTFLFGDSDEIHYIGKNPLANGEYFPSFSDRNAVSTPFSNADKVIYDSLIVNPSLLRNCKSIRYVVSDSKTGEIYASETQEYIRKDSPYGNYRYIQTTCFVFDPVYTAPNEFGEIVEQYIASGTDITISIYTLLDHPDATERLEAEYTVTVDYTAPEFYYEYDADTKTLTVKCSDSEYLAGIVLEKAGDDNDLETTLERRIYADKTPGLAYTETFDLSDYDGDSIRITVSDYASNMVTMELSLTSGDVSNMEGSAIVGNEIEVDFADPLYLHQEIDFTVVPAEGYCVADDFAIFVNGEQVAPIAVENGIYSYRIILTEEELTITSAGVMAHSFVPIVTTAETCTADGELSHVCSNCSYVGRVEVIPSQGHIKGTAVTLVEPTCISEGISAISCTKCGLILETPSIAACGHTEGEFKTVKEATCVEAALKVKVCLVCETVLDVAQIDATGHKSGELKVLIEATCSSSGLSIVCCETCGVTLSTTAIDKIGHTLGEAVITKEATCVEPGSSVVKCETCDSILESSIIPAVGHDNTSGDKATAFSPAVCGVCGQSYGNVDSNGVLVLVLVLSVVATLATIFTAVVVFVKKKR